MSRRITRRKHRALRTKARQRQAQRRQARQARAHQERRVEAALRGSPDYSRRPHRQRWSLSLYAKQNHITGKHRRRMMRLNRALMDRKLDTYDRYLFLAGVAAQHWVRKPELLPMLSGCGSRQEQRQRVVEHLLLRWPVPRFMLSWLAPVSSQSRRDSLESTLWGARMIAHLGRGSALRDAPFGVPLTRRMRKLFMQSPDRIGPVEAVRRAQVLGAGGNHRLLRAVMQTGLEQLQTGAFGDRESWWHRIICWLATRSTLPVSRVPALIRWLFHVRAAGEDYDPCGRPLASVLRRLSVFEDDQRLLRDACSWEGEGLSIDAEIRFKKRVWQVQEIRTPQELLVTGRAMANCAWTYQNQIAAGKAALFSVRQGRSRRALIEVRLPAGQICQVKAKANHSPSEEACMVVRHWAHQHGLKLKTSDV